MLIRYTEMPASLMYDTAGISAANAGRGFIIQREIMTTNSPIKISKVCLACRVISVFVG